MIVAIDQQRGRYVQVSVLLTGVDLDKLRPETVDCLYSGIEQGVLDAVAIAHHTLAQLEAQRARQEQEDANGDAPRD